MGNTYLVVQGFGVGAAALRDRAECPRLDRERSLVVFAELG